MKKIKFEGKLNLNKETVAKLNKDHMESIQGGAILWTLIGCKPKKSFDDNCTVTAGDTCTCPSPNSEHTSPNCNTFRL
jgi:hypothetical protein